MTANVTLKNPTVKKYLTKTIVEDGQTVFLVTPELFEALALRPGEVLEWHISSPTDKEIVIKRHHVIDNKIT